MKTKHYQLKESNLTGGDWSYACDSYGKVQHSRKACVFSSIKTDTGDRLITIAARIPNWDDAQVISAARDMFLALKYMNHVTEGGYCICPINDGNRPDIHHASICEDARKALRKAETGDAAEA